MDDDSEELARRIARPLGQYAELYPDIERRLLGVLRSRDPKVLQRLAPLGKIARLRSEALRERLIARYRLTATEARVAAWLADGGDIAAYAETHGVSAGTVRIQLKSVYAKTGVSRQAALVKLAQTVF